MLEPTGQSHLFYPLSLSPFLSLFISYLLFSSLLSLILLLSSTSTTPTHFFLPFLHLSSIIVMSFVSHV